MPILSAMVQHEAIRATLAPKKTAVGLGEREHGTVTHRGETLEYIELAKDDIALANRIAHEVPGRTLDELPPQTRRRLKLIHSTVLERSQNEHVKPREVRFTRRDIREHTLKR